MDLIKIVGWSIEKDLDKYQNDLKEEQLAMGWY